MPVSPRPQQEIFIDSVFYKINGNAILNGVACKIRPHKITAIFGRNGCGKSTFFNLITGLKNTQNMQIEYNGNRLSSLYQYPNLIAYLPQKNIVPSSFQIQTLAKLLDVAEQQLVGVLQKTKLDPKAKMFELSYGYRKLVSILLLLYTPKLFLILDEPFSGLSPIHMELLQDELRNSLTHKGILIADHNFEMVNTISDYSYVMKEGQLMITSSEADLVQWGYLPS